MNTQTPTNQEEQTRIAQQAADWFAKRQTKNFTDSQEAQFQRWLQSDPVHGLMYAQCETRWEMSALLADDVDIARELQHARNATGSRPVFSRWLRSAQRHGVAAVAMAATLVLALGVVFFSGYSPYEEFSTGVGEQRLVRLNDGSSVMLNTNTVLQVNINARERSLSLLQGEAYFTVAKDSSRPFEVSAGPSIVRAVGTEFNVQYRVQDIGVSVTEGIVEVEAQIQSQQQSQPQVVAQLTVGQAVSYSREQQPLEARPSIEAANLERISAWQVRQIYFNANTLAEAIAEYGRYTDVQIELLHQDIAEQKITGVFNVGDLESFIFALEQLLDVEVVRNGERVFVTRKSDKASQP
ncbi:DUF4880 domain-containing protein [Pseudomaricurvus alkylphenolicus]|uniref:FecR family protein n=1 Tax=Pseudomaricurvus alkylphenolicus TaxID=1306991 RepID=UPI00142079A9|nr:FecR domain-containing protein [Pseudomaricurvus alkylphenolicus]NIB43674.1 DUF4880 domain-containing protein [Pseudomaricurvus alkylphenolicus]